MNSAPSMVNTSWYLHRRMTSDVSTGKGFGSCNLLLLLLLVLAATGTAAAGDAPEAAAAEVSLCAPAKVNLAAAQSAHIGLQCRQELNRQYVWLLGKQVPQDPDVGAMQRHQRAVMVLSWVVRMTSHMILASRICMNVRCSKSHLQQERPRHGLPLLAGVLQCVACRLTSLRKMRCVAIDRHTMSIARCSLSAGPRALM